MKTQDIIIVIVAVLLLLVGIHFFHDDTYVFPVPVPAETHHCSGLYDRNDIEICEDNVLSDGDQYLPNTVHFGLYEGTEQFYTTNDEGFMDILHDLGEGPKEQRSLIIE